MAKVTLGILKNDSYFSGVLGILRKEQVSKRIIYVCVNKPYAQVVQAMKRSKVDPDNILFIDTLCNISNDLHKDYPNRVCIDSPENLTGLSIAISACGKKESRVKKVIILDSFSALLIYHGKDVIGRFANFMISKLKAEGTDFIILVTDNDLGKDEIRFLQTIVDEVKEYDS